jgi:hypothetical protein
MLFEVADALLFGAVSGVAAAGGAEGLGAEVALPGAGAADVPLPHAASIPAGARIPSAAAKRRPCPSMAAQSIRTPRGRDSALTSIISAFFGAMVAIGTAGCDEPQETPCGLLGEEGACPESRGGSCDDRSCTALYRCEDGDWTFSKRCDRSGDDAGAPDDASFEDATSVPECVASQAPVEASCEPLQLPECDARIADECQASACLTGCEAFLRCVDGQWAAALAAYCEDGVLMNAP